MGDAVLAGGGGGRGRRIHARDRRFKLCKTNIGEEEEGKEQGGAMGVEMLLS